MPGPFPGMDPYLENASLWQGFHNAFIAACVESLNASLPADLVATGEVRVRIGPADSIARPDVAVTTHFATARNVPRTSGSGLAMLEAPLTVHAPPEEERQAFLTIRDIGRGQTVVTALELLSPSNKREPGRLEYVAKQQEYLWSETNLVEIDLLRRGQHTIAAPEAALRQDAPDARYVVCIHRPAQRWHFDLWPIALRERLPRLPIPLRESDAPVLLDLQELLDVRYDAGRYGSLLRYDLPPEDPLDPADALWAQSLLMSR